METINISANVMKFEVRVKWVKNAPMKYLFAHKIQHCVAFQLFKTDKCEVFEKRN